MEKMKTITLEKLHDKIYNLLSEHVFPNADAYICTLAIDSFIIEAKEEWCRQQRENCEGNWDEYKWGDFPDQSNAILTAPEP